MLVALVTWGIALAVVSVRWSVHPEKNSVYAVFADAGRKWQSGDNVYFPVSAFRYSPAFAAEFALLDHLGKLGGMWVWFLFNVVLFFGGLAAWAKHALPGRRDQDFVAALLLLATPMMVGNFNNLQANPAMFGCMLGATAAVVSKRFTLAAVLIGIATYLKIYPLALGLVFLVLYPRQLGWRLALVLLIGAALPLLFQNPHYALGSYGQWFESLRADQRNELATKDAYRDLALLWRYWINDHLNVPWYMALQLAGAAAVGATAFVLRRRWPERPRVLLLLTLVVVWTMLLGPSTESSTYIMLAPLATWFFLTVLLRCIEGRPGGGLLLAASLAYGLLLAAALAPAFPWGKRVHELGLQPAAALGTLGIVCFWPWGREGLFTTEPTENTETTTKGKRNDER
jgi:hypothetical protein